MPCVVSALTLPGNCALGMLSKTSWYGFICSLVFTSQLSRGLIGLLSDDTEGVLTSTGGSAVSITTAASLTEPEGEASSMPTCLHSLDPLTSSATGVFVRVSLLADSFGLADLDSDSLTRLAGLPGETVRSRFLFTLEDFDVEIAAFPKSLGPAESGSSPFCSGVEDFADFSFDLVDLESEFSLDLAGCSKAA